MSPTSARRLYVHVGLQKTGTSYLQGVMRHNAARLATQGLDLVPASLRDAFELMLLVRNRYDEQRDPATVGDALERFGAELARASGERALLSQESLAAARPVQIRRLLEACGEREVHAVLTVRDLARQLPSSWQQGLKGGSSQGFRQYLNQMQDSQREGSGKHPWIHLDPPQVLARWSEVLPAEHVHVVTVPPSGSAPTLLLERFCAVLDVDPLDLELEERRANTSLGRVQAEVLRRVNQGLSPELRRRQVYGSVGKRFFSSQVLSRQDGHPIRVPEEYRAWCEQVADHQVATLAAAGYDLFGTLEDLRCPDTAFSGTERPPTDGEVAEASIAALVHLLSLRGAAVQRRLESTHTSGFARRLTGRLRGRPRPGPEQIDQDEP